MNSISEGWLSTEELFHHRMEAIHRHRVEAINRGDSPFRLKPGGSLIVHLIPAESVPSRKRYTASNLKDHSNGLRPLGEQSGHFRFNTYGYSSYTGEREVTAYTQLYRDGHLEAVMTDTTYMQGRTKVLKDSLCERAIFEVVGEYLRFCKGIGIALPVWAFVALTDCVDMRVKTWTDLSDDVIHSPLVFLPEFEIDSFDIQPVTYLRPLFDCLANAVGLEQSLNYDKQGNWEQQGRR